MSYITSLARPVMGNTQNNKIKAAAIELPMPCASLRKMDIRKYFSVKTPDSEASSGEESDVEKHEGESSLVLADDPAVPPAKRKKLSSLSEKKKQYKAKLSYKKAWEKNHPWLQCTNPQEGMFCTICMKWGKPSPSTKGGWTARGIL